MQRRKLGGTGSPAVSPGGVPKKKVSLKSGKNRSKSEKGDTASSEIPQGFTDVAAAAVGASTISNGKKGRKRRQRAEVQESNGASWTVQFGFLVILVVAASYYVVSQHEAMQFKKIREEIVHDQVEPLSREWEEKYADLVEENERLKKASTNQQDIDKLVEEKKQFGELREAMEGKIQTLEHYKRKMQRSIQLLSHNILLEK